MSDIGVNLEFFSCAGGFAEGFRRAGITFDFAFDFESDHCDSYERNIGHRPICMDVRDVLRLARAGVFGSRVDFLCADPPCTPWSRAGLRKGTSDERDMLEDTCELIRILRPRTYLIGNVPGLDDMKNWHVVQRAIGGLQKHGYCVADFAALDAASYGVPQHRIRPFWFGHLDGPCIQWPLPTHCDPDELHTHTLPGLERLIPWVTCRQALGHLPEKELGRPVRLRRRECNSHQHGSVHDKPARVVGTSNLSDGNVLLTEPSSKHPLIDADSPSTTVRGGGNGHAAPHLVMTIPSRPIAHGSMVDGDGDSVDEDDYTRPLPKQKRSSRPTGGEGVLVSDRHPPAELDLPAPTVGARQRGQAAQLLRTKPSSRERADFEGGYTPSSMDAPAHAIVKNTHGDGSVLIYDMHHPPHDIDQPSNVIRAGDGQGGNRAMRLGVIVGDDSKHPVSDPDQPAMAIKASDGGGSKRVMRLSSEAAPKNGKRKRDEGRPGQGMRVGTPDVPSKTVTGKAARVGAGESHVLEWPWDRPSTVVAADYRLAAPGHHDEQWDGGTRSVEGAVVLSEKAAAILQGFPESWVFCGDTKKARWSQLGQAMPPALAHAVATSVRRQREATEIPSDVPPSLATGKLTVV